MGSFCTTSALDILMVGVDFDTATSNLALKCIDWAEDEVKKYLSERYDFSSSPFNTTTTTPPLVRTLSEKLAYANMWESMSRGGPESIARAESIRKDALENLKMISDYQAYLLDTAGSAISESTANHIGVKTNTKDYTSTFDEDDPLNWVVDPDKLDDIESDRS